MPTWLSTRDWQRLRKFAPPFMLPVTVLLDELRQRGITDTAVLQAIAHVPREEFVLPAMRKRAYEDTALPIDNQQTISQPYTVAAMTQLACITTGCNVLEIGTGSGYQAAILAYLGARVTTIERHPLLKQKAQVVLARLGYTNVICRVGDGTIGYMASAPYHAIIVTAGAPDVPESLAKQLAVGGHLIVPVGNAETQTMYDIQCTAPDTWKATPVGEFKFVPLIGQEGWSA
jgi:protein-L-isoaspartate(D-aspartate) O-methyltransferase